LANQIAFGHDLSLMNGELYQAAWHVKREARRSRRHDFARESAKGIF
jgi:hypothetical protein